MTIEFKTVAEAAEWLDGINPGWAERIDLKAFNIQYADRCAIGQSFCENYYDVLKCYNIKSNTVLGNTDDKKEVKQITQEWITEITNRLNASTKKKTMPVLSAIEQKLLEDFRAGKVQYKPMVKKELVFGAYHSNPSNLSDGMDFNRLMSYMYNNAYVRECPLNPKDRPIEIKITYEVPAE